MHWPLAQISCSLPPLPQSRAAVGLLRATHRLHAARAGLPTPSRPWACDDTFPQGAARGSWAVRALRARARRRPRAAAGARRGRDGPGIIMLPFWSMAAKLPDAHLLNINISDGSAPLQLGSKAEAIRADLGRLVATREFAIWGRWRNLKMSPSFSGSRPLEAADLIRVVFPGNNNPNETSLRQGLSYGATDYFARRHTILAMLYAFFTARYSQSPGR